eukprot:TRINITY_DN67610_c11_g3_i3.p1 TRINITY_DN67610_c11_g3~~TRINITY_DN67610_c11_g3_i3.p1  ORF type:complete len:338 (-),score=48.14 TRINITY_DN67610_c11_g3_i3:489-1397(-)
MEETVKNVLQTLGKQVPKVFVLRPTSSLAEAFAALGEHRILSAPVVSSNGQWCGIVDVRDLLFTVVAMYHEYGTEWPKYADCLSSNLATLFPSSSGTGDVSFLADGIGTSMPLSRVIKEKFNNPTTGVRKHRIAINNCDSSPMNIISQTDIVKYMLKVDAFGDKGGKTLQELGLAPTPVVSMNAAKKTVEGFQQMVATKASCLVIVDDEGKLVGDLSNTQLRGFTEASLPELEMPVTEFINARKKYLLTGVVQTFTAKVGDKLTDVAALCVKEKVHHVVVVDDNNKPVGVVTLSDIVAAVCG